MTTLEILALNNIHGYGPMTIRKIVDSTLNDVVSSPEDLLNLVNAYETTKKKPSFKTLEEIKRALLEAGDLLLQSQEHGIKIVSFIDEDYPQNLFQTLDANGRSEVPLFLFYKGDLGITKQKTIAIIGTVHSTTEGIEKSKHYGKLFAKCGYSIISGLENGCDSSALEGALQVKGGKTIAILSHGLDILESNENSQLAEEILAKGGLLISKYPLSKGSTRCTFSVTNRLQAALADATLVIQCKEKGPTLHTAREALKANKPVFCIDFNGMEDNLQNQGNALLVSEGAIYLEENEAVHQVAEAIKKYKS